MGYRTDYMLFAIGITEEQYNQIDIEIRKYNDSVESEGIDNNTGHWCDFDDKWYESREDMLKVSTAFPDILFVLYGEGESRTDTWREFYLGGKYQYHDAESIYSPFIPDRMRAEAESPLKDQELPDISYRQDVERAIYHCLRTILRKNENAFPWDANLIRDAEHTLIQHLERHGYAVQELQCGLE